MGFLCDSYHFLGAAAPLEAPTLHISSSREQGACRSLPRGATRHVRETPTRRQLHRSHHATHHTGGVGLLAAAAAAAHDGTFTGQAYTPARGLQDASCRPPCGTVAALLISSALMIQLLLWIVRPITHFFVLKFANFVPMPLKGPSGRQRLLKTAVTPGTKLFPP